MEKNLIKNRLVVLSPAIIGLNFLLILLYFVIITYSKYYISENILFSSPDAQQYLNTSTEFFNLNAQGNSITRTFFYPFIILITHHVFGPKSLWFFQFLCWLLSINLIYFAVNKIVKNKIYSLLIILIMALNLSYLILTLHALTEVICILLLSILIFVLANQSEKNIKQSYWILLIISLLTVTRPVFYYIWLAYFIYHSIYFFRVLKTNIRKIVITILVITPVLLQLAVMKIKYNQFKISYIDKYTLEAYLFAQSIKEKDTTITFDEAQIQAKAIEDKKTFIINNAALLFSLMMNNINESLQGYPSLFYAPGFEHRAFGRFMEITNNAYYNMHIVFIIPIIGYIFYLFKNKHQNSKSFLFIYAICLYITFTSGISFWQGDRLLITLLPLWLFLYAVVFYKFIAYLYSIIQNYKSLKYKQ